MTTMLRAGWWALAAVALPMHATGSEPPSPKFCFAAATLEARGDGLDELLAADSSDVAALEQAYRNVASAADAVAAEAPSTLADATHELSTHNRLVVILLDLYDYDRDVAATDPRWVAIADYAEANGLDAMDEEFDAFVDANCGDVAVATTVDVAGPTTTAAPPDQSEAAFCAAGEFVAAAESTLNDLSFETATPEEFAAALDELLAATDAAAVPAPVDYWEVQCFL